MGRKVSDFTNLKKRTVAVHISKRWGNDIIKEGAVSFLKKNDGVVVYLMDGPRVEQG